MACLGPIARDLDDLDLALRVISNPDGKDSDVAPVPIGPPDERRLPEMRFAVAATPPGASISATTRQMVERVAAGASDAGAMVEERLPEIDWGEMHELSGDLVGAVTGVFSPDAGLRDEQRTLGWYLAALERRDRIGAIWEAWFDDLDCLVLPVAAASAFRHCEQGADIDVEGTPVSYWAFGGPLPASNLTGMPALVVPAGLDETGLPFGVQLVGPRWSEVRLIGIARQLEKAGVLPGFRFPPGY